MHGENRSEFISVFDKTVVYREEPTLKPYERAKLPEPKADAANSPANVNKPQKVPVSPSSRTANGLDSEGRCEKWFSELELDTLHKYFARHVYREGLTFHEWLRPEALKTINLHVFYKVPRCAPTMVSAVLSKLRIHGIILDGNSQRDQGRRR